MPEVTRDPLADPMTQAHQAALARYLRSQTAQTALTAQAAPEDTLRILQDLCGPKMRCGTSSNFNGSIE